MKYFTGFATALLSLSISCKAMNTSASRVSGVDLDINKLRNAALITGYHLKAVPNTDCGGGLEVNKKGPFSLADGFVVRLNRSCSYAVNLLLGSLSSDGANLDVVYLSDGGISTVVKKDLLLDSKPFLNISLSLTPAATQAGIVSADITTQSRPSSFAPSIATSALPTVAIATAPSSGLSRSPSTQVSSSGLTAKLVTKSTWDQGYCDDLIIRNDSSAPINSWSVTLATLDITITSQWNLIMAIEANKLVLKPQYEWNTVLIPQQEVGSQGFCASFGPSATKATVEAIIGS